MVENGTLARLGPEHEVVLNEDRPVGIGQGGEGGAGQFAVFLAKRVDYCGDCGPFYLARRSKFLARLWNSGSSLSGPRRIPHRNPALPAGLLRTGLQRTGLQRTGLMSISAGIAQKMQLGTPKLAVLAGWASMIFFLPGR